MHSKVAVIGAGAFGQALAACAQAGGHDVVMYRRPDLQAEAPTHLAWELRGMDESRQPFAEMDLILLAVPAQALRDVSGWLGRVAGNAGGMRVVSAAKGIERKTLLLPHQILGEVLPPGTRVGTLSGPSFARELAAGLPTAVVAASKDVSLSKEVQAILHRPHFRVYHSDDIAGVEMGGALKNVIAMVAGGVDGLGLGNNARAAVVTRGLGEMAGMGVKLGANPMTFLGLSGLGDLILTCTGDLSRNRSFGMRLAAGESVEAICGSAGQVIEGVATAESAYDLSVKLGVDAPVMRAAYKVLYERLPIREAVLELIQRQEKGEFDWTRG